MSRAVNEPSRNEPRWLDIQAYTKVRPNGHVHQSAWQLSFPGLFIFLLAILFSCATDTAMLATRVLILKIKK
jgi:hypothetical protein